ncbi:hypothetical protein BDM02DRAFT_3190695 [Thelephora ganbajun]|uniref:Uncharacterized protein n=1 Tax=Thelephora ganbajun TaxID=370292 RepID=A0ACB6Z3R7_THEGA|nr:hypothetical protein BDM02DRAFT_3190695 [Thelephora ganbajun]
MSLNFGAPPVDLNLTPSNSHGTPASLLINAGSDFHAPLVYQINPPGLNNPWIQGFGPVHRHAGYSLDFGNHCSGDQVAIKHEAPTGITDPMYAQLLAMTQTLQQQISMISQQIAGLQQLPPAQHITTPFPPSFPPAVNFLAPMTAPSPFVVVEYLLNKYPPLPPLDKGDYDCVEFWEKREWEHGGPWVEMPSMIQDTDSASTMASVSSPTPALELPSNPVSGPDQTSDWASDLDPMVSPSECSTTPAVTLPPLTTTTSDPTSLAPKEHPAKSRRGAKSNRVTSMKRVLKQKQFHAILKETTAKGICKWDWAHENPHGSRHEFDTYFNCWATLAQLLTSTNKWQDTCLLFRLAGYKVSLEVS